MKKDLQSWLVFTETEDAGDISHGPTDKCRFEERLGGRWIGFSEERDVKIAFAVLRKVRFENLSWHVERCQRGTNNRKKSSHTCIALSVPGAEQPKTAEYKNDVENGDQNRRHRDGGEEGGKKET